MSNVISIFEKRQEKKQEVKDQFPDYVKPDLEEIAKKNKANAERVKSERLDANKSVLRSYRIKN